MAFNQEEWIHLGQWVQPTLSACFWNNWTQNNAKYPFKIGQMDGKLPFLHGHHFVRKSDVGVLRMFVKENVDNFELLNTLEKWVDDIHNSCKNRISIKFESLAKSMRNMKKVCKDVVNPWIFFLVLDNVLEEGIKNVCNKKGYDFDSVIQMITPIKKSFTVLQSERAKLLHDKIREKGLTCNFDEIKRVSPSLGGEIEKHVKMFEFVGVHHFVGEPYSVKLFLETKPAKIGKEIKQDIPKDLEWYIRLASIAAWARTHMAETSGLIQNTIKPVLLKVNQTLNFDEEDYLWLTAQELIHALENPTKFVKPNIKKRKERLGIYSNDSNDEIIVEGDIVDMLLEKILPMRKISTFPLVGRIACQGRVKGIARIVVRPEDISKVKEGDILVAPETSPDFIVGLKRAAGVITNQGGITSHAAIVSRELGIPCLVGVKDATAIFKDDQIIEVDANKGEVRLVEKKPSKYSERGNPSTNNLINQNKK